MPSDIRDTLNKKYISEVPVTISVNNRYSGFFSKHSLFIKRAVDRGSCLTLHDIDLRISETTFWNAETFEDYARIIFWTFNERFLSKLLSRIEYLNLKDIRFFIGVLRENPEPYLWAIDHPTDPYLFFCGNKLKSLNKKNYLAPAYDVDRQNRRILLKALLHLEASKNADVKKSGGQKTLSNEKPKKKRPNKLLPEKQPTKIGNEDVENNATRIANIQPLPEPKPNRSKPFTSLLNNPEIKKIIQEHLTEAGIPFAIFQRVKTVGNNRNPDGFNSAVAAMIVVFRELGYFKEDTFFDEILDAYLRETRNNIGKLNHFKRHYRESNYFQTYKENLEDLQLAKIQ